MWLVQLLILLDHLLERLLLNQPELVQQLKLRPEQVILGLCLILKRLEGVLLDYQELLSQPKQFGPQWYQLGFHQTELRHQDQDHFLQSIRPS